MSTDFYNTYVENLIKELGEYMKMKILLQTQLEVQQKITNELQEKVEKLEKAAAKTSKKKDDTF